MAETKLNRSLMRLSNEVFKSNKGIKHLKILGFVVFMLCM